MEVQWRVIGFPLHKASAGAKNRKILLPCRLSNNLGVRTHSRHAPLSLYGGERIITILDDTSSLFGMSQCTHMNNQLATKGWWRFADNSVPRLNWNFVTCHVVQSHGAQLILTTYDIKKKTHMTHIDLQDLFENESRKGTHRIYSLDSEISSLRAF